jgi:hypothetical protein
MAFTSFANTKLDTNNRLNGDQVILRDQQHAAKLFTVDQFRLAPKHNFLFHVAFNINTRTLTNPAIVQRYGQEINMLVKSADIPTVSIQNEVLNQYNRKKVVQYQSNLKEVKIKFHDDNMGLINHVWQQYYTYYYSDANAAKNNAYTRNATKKSDYITSPYGLDAGSTEPFFNYITVYQMARHEYVSYKLMNPIITNFSHSGVSYSDSKTGEWDMTLMYEAIAYDVGAVSAGAPEGFGLTHYDSSPSPLKGTNPDPTVNDPSFVTSLDTTGLNAGILNNAVATVSTYQNSQTSGAGSAASQLAGGLAIGAAAIGIGSAAVNALGGIGGIVSGIGGIVSGVKNAVGGLTDALFPGTDSESTGSDTVAAISSGIDDAAAKAAQTVSDLPQPDLGAAAGAASNFYGSSYDPSAGWSI